MPLRIIQGDLTRFSCDAVVNPTNELLLATGGLDRKLRDAAGPELDEACRALGGLSVGHAKMTPGYRLPARFVIHTAGPVWRGGDAGEEAALAACYRSSLALAEASGLESVAFPLIAAGSCGFPKVRALDIAVAEIRDYLETHEMDLWLVVFDRSNYEIGQNRRRAIRSLLAENAAREQRLREANVSFHLPVGAMQSLDAAPPPQAKPAALPDFRAELDESFSQMLLRKIDERGMTDAQCYKKANVDRRLFSKIRNDPHYQPRKSTAAAFAVALELDLAETRELLGKAGYALSRSYVFDKILEYFIARGEYDVFVINETLFDCDQPLLGG